MSCVSNGRLSDKHILISEGKIYKFQTLKHQINAPGLLVDRTGCVDSYRFFREVPKEETTLLCVGQYLNGSEEEGV